MEVGEMGYANESLLARSIAKAMPNMEGGQFFLLSPGDYKELPKTALGVASSFMEWTIGFCFHIFVESMPGPGNRLQSDFAASGPENYSGLSREGDRGRGYPLDVFCMEGKET